MNKPLKQWYCIHSKPQMENQARFHLERQHIQVFMPLIKTRRLYRRKYIHQTLPLFPRYLFAKFNFNETGTKVKSTRGIGRLVSFGPQPAVVPECVINEIENRCVEGHVVEMTGGLKKGDILSVVAGPYTGLSAVFERNTSAADRVIILLDIMNTSASVEIDTSALKLEE